MYFYFHKVLKTSILPQIDMRHIIILYNFIILNMEICFGKTKNI